MTDRDDIVAHDRIGGRWLPPFLLGLNTQVAQLLILREAMILSSGSETAIGLCLGAWALLNGAGALAGWAIVRAGWRADRLFMPLLGLLPLLIAASIQLARVARALTDAAPAEHLSVTAFLGLALLVVGPVTLVDGFLFVSGLGYLFGRRRTARGTACAAKSAAYMYGVESLGSLAGGVLFSFVLVLILDPFSIAGTLLCLNGLGLIRAGRDGGRGRPLHVFRAALLLAGMAGLIFGSALNALSERSRWSVLQPEMELIATRDSRYQNLAVLTYGGEPTIFANGSVLHGLRPRLEGDRWDWNRAVFPHFAMLQHAAPRSVLLVGGVSRGLASDIVLHGPERLDLVEFDGALLDIAVPYLAADEKRTLDDPRVETHLVDGRHFVITAPEAAFDLIVLDLPDPSNASMNRYYTEEFLASCGRALRPDGVLVFSLSNQPSHIGRAMLERNGSILAALDRVFGEWLITPGENSFVAATRGAGSLTASADALLERYEDRGIDSPRFSPYVFYSWFDESGVEWVNRTYRDAIAGGHIAPNSDNRPVAYVKDYLLWRRITETDRSSGGPGLLERWLSGTDGSAPLPVFLPFLFPMAGVAFLLLRLVGGRVNAIRSGAPRCLHLTTAAAVGFNGIVLEVGILLYYQGIAGHLYSRMGIIIAAYMAGLVAGSLLPGERRFPGALFVFSCICTFTGVGGVFGLMALCRGGADQEAGPLGFSLVTAILGASGGLAFRGGVVALERSGRSPGGLVYALDILGTCLGGLLAGSVMVPLLGIAGVMMLAGCLNVILPLLSLASIHVTQPAPRGAR